MFKLALLLWVFCIYLLRIVYTLLIVLSVVAVVMATGGGAAPPHVGDVEEDASQLLFPKGNITFTMIHRLFDTLVIFIP